MKKQIGKLYNRFTGLERLRLAVEARARGDEQEVDNLVRSCPREHFSASEDAYTAPLKATVELVEATCQDFALYKGRLEALDVVRLILLGLETKLQKKNGDIVRALNAIIAFQIDPLRLTILADIKGEYEALKHFFQRKLDLHSDSILKAFEPTYWKWLESLKEEFSIVEIDPEWVAEYEKKLENAWNLMLK